MNEFINLSSFFDATKSNYIMQNKSYNKYSLKKFRHHIFLKKFNFAIFLIHIYNVGIFHRNTRRYKMFEFERVTNLNSLQSAWKKVSTKNSVCGTDQVDVHFYKQNEAENLLRLQFSLKNFMYTPYGEKKFEFNNRAIFIQCIEYKRHCYKAGPV